MLGSRRRIWRGVTPVLVVAALIATVAPLSGAARASSAPALVRHSGYLTMADGVRLRYTVVHPAGKGRYPTLLEYSGYDPGTNPDAAYIKQFLVQDGGYAYVGLNLRGTGCSTGTFDFFQPQEARDGARAIEWITHQTWSDGKVGMIGKSYPGITQLFVAEQQPPGLVAIAPGHFFADAYRDIARPGGLANLGFSSLWSFVARPSYEFSSSPGQVAAGDANCLNGSTAEVRGLPTNPFVQLVQHPYDDALYAQRSPITHLDRIRVPMLATLAWQDEQLGSRNTEMLGALDDLNRARAAHQQPVTPWWATLTNGDHGMARTPTELADLQRFFDHFLKGIDNGWDHRPRVQVWWEAGRNGSRAPGWVTGLDHWSDTQRAVSPLTLNLGTGGWSGSTWVDAPVASSQGIANPAYGYPGLPNVYDWSLSPPKGAAVAWTSAPVARDMTFLGSASADLWITSSAPDTDLEVMLTEVRPDGKEVYVEKGWLKASQRAIDPARSTPLRPYQWDTAAKAAPLVPGQPTLMRVELFPFGTLIRKGSRLRLWVQAPTMLPELWSFPPPPYPAVNTVLHDTSHVSRLVLPLVPNDPNRVAAYPVCNTVIRQPCRSDPLAA
jgi:predicted acyl esterase